MSSTQHQLIEQCATRLRGIVEALDNIHDNTPHRWSADLDDVHSSAESLLAMIKDQAPARSEASFEEWLANELEGEDGQPVPAAACDITLARRAFNHWPKLEQPAKVGGVRFSAGVSSRLVVEAAQRLYEFESTPEKEAERIDPEQESVEQAGGDERVKCAVCVDSGKVYDISGEGPWKCYACTGSHEVIGYANGDELDNMLDDRTAVLSPVKTSFHTVPVYREARATLAQPSPASDLDPFNLAPHAEAFNEAPDEALRPEQAGGDERDFQAEGAQEVPSPVSQEYDRHLISLLRKGEALPGHQEEAADEIERLRDWNDHLNNTVLPNILNPNFLMLMKGGERLLDLCTKDGKFIGVSLNDMKDVFDWMVTHARIAPDHAALAQPSQAQAEAEAERPEVVAWQYRVTAGPQTGWSLWHPGKGEEFERSYTVERRPLMTVAQHERIVGELRAVIAQLRQHKNDYMDSGQETYRALQNEIREREAEIARLDGLVSGRTAERDAALARVAELERQEPVALANRGLHAFWVKWTEAAAGLYGPGIKLYAAPVAQAQHSVPEVSGIGRDFAYPRSVVLYLRTEPTDDDLRAIHDGLRSLAAAPGNSAQHSVPEGWKLVPIEPLLNMMSDKDHDTRITAERQLLSILADAPVNLVPQAWLDVQAERRRQVEAEGWTPEHDDEHSHGQMARAAACYALAGSSAPNDGTAALLVSLAWPWDEQWWKPTSARRDLIKACALTLAEIERLDRAGISQNPQPGATTASS